MGNLGYQNMISEVKKQFFQTYLKNGTKIFIKKCQECQLVKAVHQHPSGLPQRLPSPEWKWEVISMDFIIGLPKRNKQSDSTFLLVDKLSKVGHFIAVKSTYKAVPIVDIFLKEIFRLDGIPKEIISDRDTQLTNIN